MFLDVSSAIQLFCASECRYHFPCFFFSTFRTHLRLQLQYVADADYREPDLPRPVAYDNASGEVSYPPGFREQTRLVRLSDKQLVPRTPDFQCPETECFIPRSFVDDDFCDCPLSCADETYHTCDSCGVDLPAFSAESDACRYWKPCKRFTSLGTVAVGNDWWDSSRDDRTWYASETKNYWVIMDHYEWAVHCNLWMCGLLT